MSPTPSLATAISAGSAPFFAFSFSFSSFFIAREAFAISVVPLMSAAMPVPEPPPVTWTFLSGFFRM